MASTGTLPFGFFITSWPPGAVSEGEIIDPPVELMVDNSQYANTHNVRLTDIYATIVCLRSDSVGQETLVDALDGHTLVYPRLYEFGGVVQAYFTFDGISFKDGTSDGPYWFRLDVRGRVGLMCRFWADQDPYIGWTDRMRRHHI